METQGGSFEVFFRDCDEQLAQAEDVLLALEGGDPEVVNRAFRIFHTIKGAAAMFGIVEIRAFTHQLETILDHLRAGHLTATPELVDAVLASKDHLVELVGAARRGQEAPAAPPALMAALDALAPAPAPAAPPETSALAPKRFAIRLRGREGTTFSRSQVQPALDDLATLGSVTLADEMPYASSIETLIGLDLEIVTTRTANAIRDRFVFVESDVDVTIEEQFFFAGAGATVVLFDDADLMADRFATPEPPPSAEAPPQRVAPPPAAPERAVPGPPRPESDATVRVSSEKLDRLVSLVSELVITQSRLVEVASRHADPELASPVEEIERLVGELREGVLGVRMTAIGSTFGRFRRLVRDLSRQLDKDVELVTDGAETEVDKSVLDQLVDPLMHLLRNALDHGIEPPAERLAAGKAARGRVRLAASHVGQRVVVTIEDDGKGMDPEAIRRKAIERGLIAEGAPLSEEELFALVFLPGFSTASAVTDVSGRGVGMDVVRRQIEALRGTVRITSQRHVGTRMALELPLTLAIIDGLLVEVAGDRYVVPLSAVTENVELPRGDRERHNGRRLVLVREELVPYVPLRDLFGFGAPPSGEDEKVVLLQVGEDRFGIVVDRVIGSHQTVIQPLGPLFRRIEVVSGATILGDGRVAPILDLAGIIRRVHGGAPRGPMLAA